MNFESYNPRRMLRTLYVGLVAAFWSVIIGLTVIPFALITPKAHLIDRLIRFWARQIMAAAGVDLSVEHRERVDPSRNYVIIANHASYLDIPALFSVVPQGLRFMAKKSLFVIPVFGWAIRATGFIPIDRKDRSSAAQSFDLAARQIRSGKTVVVFPEEGRSRTREMKPFKRGAFLLALKAGLPIVPVAIRGMYDVLPATRLRVHPGPVKIIFGEPIDTSAYSVRQRDELSELTRGRILEMLGEARS
jgi:1-acyl-sn-glycerol-3-phosphate acyltransferase